MSNAKLTRISETRLLLAIGALYLLMQVITALKIYSQRTMDAMPIDYGSLLEDRIVALVIGMLFITLIFKTTKRFLLDHIAWAKIIAIHLLFAVIFSFLWYSSFILVSHLLCRGADCDRPGADFVFWFLINFDKLFLLYLFTATMTYTYYYVQRDSVNQIQRQEMTNQLLQTRLMMLKSQLQPHFLFNTLNSIASLMDIDVKKAQTMIADLGDLLRHVLDHKDTQMASLPEEMDLLRKYVNIEKTRFSDDLDVEWKIGDEIPDIEVPGMLMQPLVENAIRHGFSRMHDHLHVRISAYCDNGHLHLLVEDNGRGFEEEKTDRLFATGTGLHNTYERLRSIYGDRFTFKVENTHPGVRSHIVLPVTL